MRLETAEQFWSVLRASRLLPARELDGLAAAPAQDAASACAQALVDRKLLTEYQAEQLLTGHGAGLVLGQYRILERLAAGGMGEVFKSEHVLMKRVVALKIIANIDRPGSTSGRVEHQAIQPPHAAAFRRAHAEAVEQFHREVQAAAQLCHPNIVMAFDAEEAQGLHFLVMEYVDGVDLGRLVAEVGPLPVTLACDCIRQAALGLQYAYEHGLIHGDIKPSNLLLQGPDVRKSVTTFSVLPTPLVKILDLGLARLASGSSGVGEESDAVCGTPDYLAPELARNARAGDIRSDIYSLGCTLYYLLAGQVPFPGGTWTEKLVKHQLELATPLRTLRPEVPDAVAAMVECMMASEPSERYSVPAAVAAELQEWLSTQAKARRETRTELLCSLDTPLESEVPSWPRVPVLSLGSANRAEVPRPAVPRTISRSHVSLAVGLVFAIAIGLVAAWLLRRPATISDSLDLLHADVSKPASFTVASTSKAYMSLSAAIAAAGDGDTIAISHDGAIALGPIDIRGKSLTLRAASGSRPSLRFLAGRRRNFWQAMLTTDRDLAIEGLELGTLAGENGHATEHLIVSQDSTLLLKGCRLVSPHAAGSIVCRNPTAVHVERCQFQARHLPLFIEAGQGSLSDIRLQECKIEVAEQNGTALSVWAPEVRKPGTVHIRMEHNTLHAGRILAFTALPHRIELDAEHNDFTFREALLCYADMGRPDSWRRLTSWRGHDNHYHGTCDWLSLDGVGFGIHDLSDWQTLWGRAESGSLVASSQR
jgi:serine/threonine-protein kinase